MERRRDERLALGLKATLLDSAGMPRACRVRDFSRFGMRLQYDYDSSAAGFDQGDAVTVRLSLRGAGERNVITLPSTVTRVELNGIGVEFHQPQAALPQLLETYRLDRPQEAVRAPGEESTEVAELAGRSIGREAFGYRAGAASVHPARRARPGGAAAGHRPPAAKALQFFIENRKLSYMGLAALALAALILVFGPGDSADIEERLSALEATTRHHAKALSAMPTPFRPAALSEAALQGLTERVEHLAVSLTALETRIASTAVGAPSTAQALPEPPAPRPLRPVGTDAGEPQAVAADTGAAPTPEQGDWLINLASSSSSQAAQRFVSRAAAAGIRVEPNPTTVKGREIWRLQVTGFATREEARTYAATASDKLGLKDFWIYRR